MINEITKINVSDVMEAANAGENITVIINGEYYDFDADGAADLFNNAIKFAAAAIEDNRARRNFCFEAIENRNPKTTKKAAACNKARNDEVKYLVDFLVNFVANYQGFNPWLEDYKNGNFWKLK